MLYILSPILFPKLGWRPNEVILHDIIFSKIELVHLDKVRLVRLERGHHALRRT